MCVGKGVVGWAGGWPLFVYGWREVFVPLVVLAHNEHGPSLAVAGLAVAATRLGGWLVAKTSLRRPLFPNHRPQPPCVTVEKEQALQLIGQGHVSRQD